MGLSVVMNCYDMPVWKLWVGWVWIAGLDRNIKHHDSILGLLHICTTKEATVNILCSKH